MFRNTGFRPPPLLSLLALTLLLGFSFLCAPAFAFQAHSVQPPDVGKSVLVSVKVFKKFQAQTAIQAKRVHTLRKKLNQTQALYQRAVVLWQYCKGHPGQRYRVKKSPLMYMLSGLSFSATAFAFCTCHERPTQVYAVSLRTKFTKPRPRSNPPPDVGKSHQLFKLSALSKSALTQRNQGTYSGQPQSKVNRRLWRYQQQV